MSGEQGQGQALKITLPFSDISKCNNDAKVRAEVSEAADERLPLGTDVWYSFRFKIPSEMQGRIGYRRFVVAQMKQHPSDCARGKGEADITELRDGNPTVSIRIMEDTEGKSAGVALYASTVYLTKVQAGIVMRPSKEFFDTWHVLKLHAKLVPRAEGAPVPPDPGIIEGSLDGQTFGEPYGKTSGEPYGYPTLTGCTYFKFGIYGDPESGKPWTALVDRFRRGSTEADVN